MICSLSHVTEETSLEIEWDIKVALNIKESSESEFYSVKRFIKVNMNTRGSVAAEP